MDEIPKFGDSRWNEYVLSLLEPDEMWEGFPKTDGMRRIANIVYAKTLLSESRVVQFPNALELWATVEHKLSFKDRDGDVVSFQDVADSHPGNTKGIFINFPSATCATKAEGRALRKALGLKTLSYEEVKDQPDMEKNLATASQIVGICNLCSKMDVNVEKYVNAGAGKYKKMTDIPFGTAASMFRNLNDYQAGRKTIPDNLKGYTKPSEKLTGVKNESEA